MRNRIIVQGSVIAALSGLLLAAQVASTPAVSSAAACSAVEMIVARGTSEPGWLGVVVGDPVFASLRAMVPSTTAYPVNYPADLTNPTSITTGISDLVNRVTRQASVCPHQRFVLVGYSQGAVVVDAALGVGPSNVTVPRWAEPKIAAVLLFGNPIRLFGWTLPRTYAGRTGDFCAAGDPICELGGRADATAHVSYASDARSAATFAARRLR